MTKPRKGMDDFKRILSLKTTSLMIWKGSILCVATSA